MRDLSGREWAAVLPLVVLMIWMGTATQSFLPPITKSGAAILESTKVGVSFEVRGREPSWRTLQRAAVGFSPRSAHAGPPHPEVARAR
jgi:hypothetical protein